MKLKSLFRAALCCAAASLAASSAKATTASPEDLLLCFRSTGNGSATNLIVDLGNYGSPAASLNLAADLAVFTSGTTPWNDNPNLTWSVLATNGASATADGLPADTLWITSKGPADTAPIASSQSAQVTGQKDITSLYGEYNNNGTPGTAAGADTISSGDSKSYSSQFSAFSAYNPALEQTGDIGTGSDSSDLFELIPSTSSNSSSSTAVDQFTLNSSGVFTTQAIPEPSTWAMIGLGAFSLLAIRRRRTA